MRVPQCVLQRRRCIVACTVLALLWAQWLVMGHAVQHAGGIVTVVRAAGDADIQHVLGGYHDAGAAACALLDHLLSGQGVAPHVQTLPVCTPHGAVSLSLTSAFRAGQPTGYDARAPPHAASEFFGIRGDLIAAVIPHRAGQEAVRTTVHI